MNDPKQFLNILKITRAQPVSGTGKKYVISHLEKFNSSLFYFILISCIFNNNSIFMLSQKFFFKFRQVKENLHKKE